jgi:ABC-type lipoprotein export system ATPase subunit
MLGGLDKATMGKIFIDGKDLFKMNNHQLMRYKRDTVGFIWQNNARNLLPYLTALENVEFPMVIAGKSKRHQRAKQLLEAVGMGNRMDSRLNQLSGGELQRVAICIAMANNPKILMADEPTGSVDSKTTDQILDVFRELNKNFGVTIVIVTHDRQVSRKVDRVVALSDGKTSSEFIKKQYMLEDEEDTHIEYAIVDKSRRIQIPADYIEKLDLGKQSMVRLGMTDDKIIISSPKSFLDSRNKPVEV